MFYAVLTKNANQRFAIICDNIQMRNRAKQKQLDSAIPPPLAANTANRHIPIAQLCPRRRAWGNHNDLTHHILWDIGRAWLYTHDIARFRQGIQRHPPMLITELCKAFGAVNVLGHIRQPVMDLFNIGPIGDGYQFANKLRAV